MKNLKEDGKEYNNLRKDIKILYVSSVISFLLILPASFFSGNLFFHVLNCFMIFFTLLLTRLLSLKYKKDSCSMSIAGQKMMKFEFILFSILAMALGIWLIQFSEFNLFSVFVVVLSLGILFFRTVKCVRCFSEGTAIKEEIIFRFYNSYLILLPCSYAIVYFYFAMTFWYKLK